MKRLEEIRKGIFPEDGQKLLAESRQLGEAKDSFMLAEILPFRMFCETQYGQKECYQDIISQFRQVKDRDYDRMFQAPAREKKQKAWNWHISWLPVQIPWNLPLLKFMSITAILQI